jgi:hypothetical protein
LSPFSVFNMKQPSTDSDETDGSELEMEWNKLQIILHWNASHRDKANIEINCWKGSSLSNQYLNEFLSLILPFTSLSILQSWTQWESTQINNLYSPVRFFSTVWLLSVDTNGMEFDIGNVNW